MYLLTKGKKLINLDKVKGIYYWGMPGIGRNDVVYEYEDGKCYLLAGFTCKEQAEALVNDIAKAMAKGLEVYAPFAKEDLGYEHNDD